MNIRGGGGVDARAYTEGIRSERIITIRGDVVLRPAGPWTPTVHALLRHLNAQNLPVPEPLEL